MHLKNELLANEQSEAAASNRLEISEKPDAHIYSVGCFRIDMDRVSVQDLKAMRKLLPKLEYKLLKSRKCARLNRSRRKEQTEELLAENNRLKAENAMLREKLGLQPVQPSGPSGRDYFDSDSESENDTGGAVSKLEVKPAAMVTTAQPLWNSCDTGNQCMSSSYFEESEQVGKSLY